VCDELQTKEMLSICLSKLSGHPTRVHRPLLTAIDRTWTLTIISPRQRLLGHYFHLLKMPRLGGRSPMPFVSGGFVGESVVARRHVANFRQRCDLGDLQSRSARSVCACPSGLCCCSRKILVMKNERWYCIYDLCKTLQCKVFVIR